MRRAKNKTQEHKDKEQEKRWCLCKEPWDERFMIFCDQCESWFHGDCVGVSEEGLPETWFCPPCARILTKIQNLELKLAEERQAIIQIVSNREEQLKHDLMEEVHKVLQNTNPSRSLDEELKISLSLADGLQKELNSEKEKSDSMKQLLSESNTVNKNLKDNVQELRQHKQLLEQELNSAKEESEKFQQVISNLNEKHNELASCPSETTSRNDILKKEIQELQNQKQNIQGEFNLGRKQCQNANQIVDGLKEKLDESNRLLCKNDKINANLKEKLQEVTQTKSSLTQQIIEWEAKYNTVIQQLKSLKKENPPTSTSGDGGQICSAPQEVAPHKENDRASADTEGSCDFLPSQSLMSQNPSKTPKRRSLSLRGRTSTTPTNVQNSQGGSTERVHTTSKN